MSATCAHLWCEVPYEIVLDGFGALSVKSVEALLAIKMEFFRQDILVPCMVE